MANVASGELASFIRGLSKNMAAEMLTDVSDADLVKMVIRAGDESAMLALMHRHGPMVYRVCRRVLRHHQDAEDAFQATFLVLAKRIGSVRKHASIASWLHGVANRVAHKARAQTAARRYHEQQTAATAVEPVHEPSWTELRAVLDAELSALPEKWRAPLVLCYLEGRTQDEAARQLHWSKSTIRRRLEEARAALAKRLSRRGVVWSAAFAGILITDCATLAVPPALFRATLEGLASVLGKTMASVTFSARVAALTEEMVLSMVMTKAKAVGTVSISCAVVLVSGWFLWSAAKCEEPGRSPPNDVAVADPKGPATASTAFEAPSKPQAERKIKLPAIIGGTVKSPDNKPCVSARVTIVLLENNDGLSTERVRRWEAVTDAKGAYEISTKGLGPLLPDWLFEIRAAAKDVPETAAYQDVQTAATKQRLNDVKLLSGVAVHGRIVDPDGRPAKGVFLYQGSLLSANETWLPRAAPVGDDGRFRLVLPAGSDGKTVAVEVVALSTDWAPKRVSLAAGADPNLRDIRLDRGTVVEGRLVDEQKWPIVDAIIVAESDDSGAIRNFGYPWTLAARTDKDGFFRFPSPITEKINLWVTNRVDNAFVGGEIQTVKTNRPEVMVIPRALVIDGKGPPTLKLSLHSVPLISIRGTARWADGKPAQRVMVQPVFHPSGGSTVGSIRGVWTNAGGKYELKAPKGVPGFSIMVGGRSERGLIYMPHPAGKKLGVRQTIGEAHFDRIDQSIDGVDWEMRLNEVPKETPAPKQAPTPAEAELTALDRAAVEGMKRLLKQAEQAKTEKDRVALWRSAAHHDEKLVQSIFELEKKQRGQSAGLLSLALVMRLAQIDGDPDSAAARRRGQAIGILAEHYLQHEDLDLCLEGLHGGSPLFGFEILCDAAAKKSPHLHVRAGALFHWAMLLNEIAALKTGLPSLLAQLEGEPGAANALARKWVLAMKPRLDAIDGFKARKEAEALAQRVVEEYPNVQRIARSAETDSFLMRRVAWSERHARTYAGDAQLLLFELRNLGVGQVAPVFEGQDADKQRLKLSDLRGKVVVLMFSANWCSPCKKAYPVLRELEKKYAGRLEIVTVMADNEVRTVKQAQEKQEITWRALWDGPSGPIATRWNVQAYPTIYLLDSAGVIGARDIGVVGLAEQVERLLAASVK
jgi:RNA polymerase sigma factor (sigma-70 family)